MRHDASPLAPLDHVVVETPLVAAGEWRCARTDPRFADSGPIEHYLVAFPRTSVRIAHRGQGGFVADPRCCTIYNRGQRYTREAIDAAGDRCDWWAVDAALARAIAAAVDAPSQRDSDRPFRFCRAPVDGALYRDQRAALAALRVGGLDVLEVEETIVALLTRAIRAAAVAHRQPEAAARPPHVCAARRQRELADAARALVGARFRDKLGLRALADALGTSPFHLCRVFRRHAGIPLHRHVTALRVRAAMELAGDAAADLSAIALDVGFSSHSHLTAAFRSELGITPSAWRRDLARAARRVSHAASARRT